LEQGKPNFRETFGNTPKVPRNEGKVRRQIGENEKIDKNHLQLEKNSYFCSPKNCPDRAGIEVNN
jgi:hypothetical protein